MHSINDLADILGLSTDQVRNRLDLLGPRLDQYTKRGAKNKILIDNNGLEILKQVKELESQGLSFKQIQTRLARELSSNGQDKETNFNLTELIREKDKRIKLLEDQISELRQDKEFLQERVTELETKLLPGNTDHKGIIRRFWEKLW